MRQVFGVGAPIVQPLLVTHELPFAMTIKIEEYIREDESNPYQQWFDTLNAQAAAKVTVAKLRMELGNTSSIKWFDGMGEYVIDRGARLSDLPGKRR